MAEISYFPIDANSNVTNNMEEVVRVTEKLNTDLEGDQDRQDNEDEANVPSIRTDEVMRP